MKNILKLLCFALILYSPKAYAESYAQFLEHYDALLGTHIHPSEKNNITYNGVDYIAWSKDQNYIKARDILAEIDPAIFKTNSEKIAFWSNAYNFLTIDLIIREEETETIKNLGDFFITPWKKYSWQIHDGSYTLDEIEHSILRQLDEPRIHFAVNCAAISCPDLRVEAYRAENLDQQLAEQTKLTLNNETKGYLYNERQNTVYVSKVMSWFKKDFSNGNVRAWLMPYKQAEMNSATKVAFLHYDWALNSVSKMPDKNDS